MLNPDFERRMSPLLAFAAREGWHSHHLEDGRIELRKPGLPPIHLGVSHSLLSTQGEKRHD
jgi:hypothetical protein